MKKLRIAVRDYHVTMKTDPKKKSKKTPPIKVKEDPKATILKHASDDVLAMAIRDMMKKK